MAAKSKAKTKIVKVGHEPRTLRVLTNYGGKPTNEQRILPGDYPVEDPRLFGLSDYLVDVVQCAEWLTGIQYFRQDEPDESIADLMNEEMG